MSEQPTEEGRPVETTGDATRDAIGAYSDKVAEHLDRIIVSDLIGKASPSSAEAAPSVPESSGRPSGHPDAESVLRARIEDLEGQLLDAKTELRIANSTIRVQETEINLLAGVIARDRTRVQAETAVAAHQIAAATTPHKRRDDGQ